jgi:hypothetical protein
MQQTRKSATFRLHFGSAGYAPQILWDDLKNVKWGCKILIAKQGKEDILEDLGLNGRITLKQILKK